MCCTLFVRRIDDGERLANSPGHAPVSISAKTIPRGSSLRFIRFPTFMMVPVRHSGGRRGRYRFFFGQEIPPCQRVLPLFLTNIVQICIMKYTRVSYVAVARRLPNRWIFVPCTRCAPANGDRASSHRRV